LLAIGDAMPLYVLYDNRCGLCSHLVQWMSTQPTSWELHFVAAGSEDARSLFPELPNPARPEELVVISGDGAVYRGDAAFIVCLYALDNCRTIAFRLSRPEVRPLARRIFGMLSTNRLRISEILGLHSDEALVRTAVTRPPDALDSGGPVW
jgi:predicted DCC family thiol-disulfide oxidoreductase YuxK